MQQRDRQQIQQHGLTTGEVERQLRLFADPPLPAALARPCAPADGILTLSGGEVEQALAAWKRAARKGRLTKFVPASGAASRMFKALQAVRSRFEAKPEIQSAAADGDADARAVVAFFDGIRRFAFHPTLVARLRAQGVDLEEWLAAGRWGEILSFVLDGQGLGLAERAKGLIEFHGAEGGARTAFEEHLCEASRYVRDGNGLCRLHFTVSPAHLQEFRALLDRLRPRLEAERGVKYEVIFSTQKSATDTIAVDRENAPFRSEEGALLFRPGGHGSLIENLNDIAGDVIFIKNIDNVLPEGRAETSNQWKQILGGTLVLVQARIHRHLEALEHEPDRASVVEAALAFARRDLQLEVPNDVAAGSLEEQRAFVVEVLDRPIRVCGMVRNEGEPGGGPFWVEGADGRVTRQIVEVAQVDRDDAGQRELLSRSTYFNPVDLVCGVRDWRGQPFDLPSYVDPDTVFIAEKSSGGRVLKALERPGLWNGAMADWITLFVEVPGETFHPVKTVLDLLRDEHQPALEHAA